MTDSNRNPERQNNGPNPDDESPAGSTGEKTFDIAELANIPRVRDDDPPYRDWWVMDHCREDGEPPPV